MQKGRGGVFGYYTHEGLSRSLLKMMFFSFSPKGEKGSCTWLRGTGITPWSLLSKKITVPLALPSLARSIFLFFLFTKVSTFFASSRLVSAGFRINHAQKYNIYVYLWYRTCTSIVHPLVEKKGKKHGYRADGWIIQKYTKNGVKFSNIWQKFMNANCKESMQIAKYRAKPLVRRLGLKMRPFYRSIRKLIRFFSWYTNYMNIHMYIYALLVYIY